jgi:hypothetical protein
VSEGGAVMKEKTKYKKKQKLGNFSHPVRNPAQSPLLWLAHHLL